MASASATATLLKPNPPPHKPSITASVSPPLPPPRRNHLLRRDFLSLAATSTVLIQSIQFLAPAPVSAAEDEEYIKDTSAVISKVRNTLSMAKTDPNVADAVAELREASNSWVAKYRKEKALLGKTSFRDIYSALNAVSGHYVSFGPTAPIPAKRKARILEEMETAEKALSRGR
ncbi:PREDICTED: photosystem II repair protein PSB27-H1, chloroplastic-like [Camelina sativa]|uniref:Photosystem II repair protein PSB27-H1, chloroplastic-like n=1 Tax=Camelina sativa TaxID=90675 RepID=A0ABM0VJZ4_CAMSA|nr:PREDICTED: photosystem II repair protein PSB27-H1, chloroplastic-like [Camelina sativa]